ncbi:acyl-coenzyme A synthetase/AMP-(fatty) acid ligase [Rhodoligotrophos appendicifer]|uniref:acyl-CoA synthetase n=1 Tax=Rhodoligotrophos appendicifer TaxID=987056 RepID=UPI001184AEAC|nr:acyl-CoA synthetase [Rhodoligotrophos appendicifer]
MNFTPADPPPARFNLARHCLAQSAAANPSRRALVVASDADGPGEVWSFAALEDRVLRLAEGFRALNLDPGARVFMRMGNSADYAFVFFALNAAGLVPIPASALLSEAEVAFMISNSRAAAIVTDGTLPLPPLDDSIEIIGPAELDRMKAGPRGPYADTAREDPAFLIYTSGTTSRPKGVLHAQRSVWGRRPMVEGWYGYRPDDVVLHSGAFNWTYTLGSGLFDPWANGLTAIVYTGPKDISVWPRLIRRHGATLMASVPTLYRQMLKHCDLSPGRLGGLRHGLCAGESLPAQLALAWRERTGTMLYEALGMSEISTYVSASPKVAPRLGSAGKPQAGRCVAILDVAGGTTPLPPGQRGLIAVHRSDPGLMLGYWERPEEEAQVFRGEWFVGGDLGRLDEDGYLHFEGRNDDLMNAFGYRVSPLEVEAVLARHPSVAEAAVVEIKVSAEVSIIAGFVVAAAGAQIDVAALKQFAATELAAYKQPRELYVVAELPRTANGKVQRRALAGLVG